MPRSPRSVTGTKVRPRDWISLATSFIARDRATMGPDWRPALATRTAACPLRCRSQATSQALLQPRAREVSTCARRPGSRSTAALSQSAGKTRPDVGLGHGRAGLFGIAENRRFAQGAARAEQGGAAGQIDLRPQPGDHLAREDDDERQWRVPVAQGGGGRDLDLHAVRAREVQGSRIQGGRSGHGEPIGWGRPILSGAPASSLTRPLRLDYKAGPREGGCGDFRLASQKRGLRPGRCPGRRPRGVFGPGLRPLGSSVAFMSGRSGLGALVAAREEER